MKKMYIISGPAGAGKSTISKRLAEQFDGSAYIEGDLISDMVISGYRPPWESEESLALTWENIADVSINFIQANKTTVIDYVAFPEEVETLSEKVYGAVKDADIFYVVLWVEKDELLRRDALRMKEYQMGARCLALADEFKRKGIDERFLYDITNIGIPDILSNIKENPRFKYVKTNF
ncbi:AAA family ATPase [Bacillus sp. NSP9.1]|uniref:AAA family ATPase n=1 Tax=Bacillus sp. NSP9.1 TaxID=1071078 RepID=UPI0004181555|nr:AAA family ATPase [Bacillus sp. NSP9.1]QHZ47029.1 AAA family ATPase [Bacillus sp. NSP9.1]